MLYIVLKLKDIDTTHVHTVCITIDKIIAVIAIPLERKHFLLVVFSGAPYRFGIYTASCGCLASFGNNKLPGADGIRTYLDRTFYECKLGWGLLLHTI